jgi:S-adenosylmethionine hydrolase
MDIITLTTDFGLTDGYPAAMKGVILKINPKVKIIDISHTILPQNIEHGAFILSSVVDYYPRTTIHVGVVDPGVGTNRECLIFKCDGGLLLGPDNGLMVPAAEKLKIQSAHKLVNFEFCLDNISSTFHGRDIFAPVAAQISKGTPVDVLGEEIDEYVKLNLYDVTERSDRLVGRVLNIDNFGNIITNFPREVIEKRFNINEAILVTSGSIDHQEKKILFKDTYEDVPKGELLAIISSSDFLEIAGNQCFANEIFNFNISDEIIIKHH